MRLAPFDKGLRARIPRDLRPRLAATLRDSRFRLRAEVGLAVALTVGLVLSIVLLLTAPTPFDPFLNDLVYQPLAPSGQVVVIAIDQKSLDEIGAWPWPHKTYADLLDQLSAARPRVIAFDLLFPQGTGDDTAFSAALKKSDNTLLALVGVQAAAYPQEHGTFPRFDVLLYPAPDLIGKPNLGHRMVLPDSDGVVRRVPVAISGSDKQLVPALGLAAAQKYMGVQQIKYDLPGKQVLLGSTRIPVDDYGRMLLNLTGVRDAIPTYSYTQVLHGQVPASALTDKIVFIGGTSKSEPETYATPLTLGSDSTFNVVVEADLADMLIRKPPRTLEQQGALDQIAVTLLFALAAGLTLPHLRPLSAAALTIIYLLILLLFAFDAFSQGMIVRILFPALALILSFFAIATFRYLSEERRRQFLTSLFRRYMPAESVGLVVDAVDRGELPLAGTRRIVTVLYCDLRGLADLSEGLAPESVLELVNRYLELMMREIHAVEGTVNKPMGDALVAIWNAPLDQPDHAERGARAAIDIRRRLAALEENDQEQPVLNLGMGLATGWAILGNMSALGKVEYTLIGETVNVAARISAFAGNNQILADTTTIEDLPVDVARRELSPVRIRGHKEPLPIWEIREPSEDLARVDEEYSE